MKRARWKQSHSEAARPKNLWALFFLIPLFSIVSMSYVFSDEEAPKKSETTIGAPGIKGKVLKKKDEVGEKPGLVGIAPSELYLEAKTKETATGYIQIYNDQTVPTRVENSLMGVTYTSDGVEQAQDIRTFPPSSPLRHLKVTPENVIIQPKSYQSFTVTAAIPENAAGMSYVRINFGAYGVQEKPLRAEKAQVVAGLQFSVGLSSLVLINVSDRSIYQMDIKEASLDLPTVTSPLSASVMVKNTGNADLTVGMRVILVDNDKKLVANLKSKEDAVMRPGTIRKIAVDPLAVELKKGSYDAIFTVKSDRGVTKVITRKITIDR